MTTSQTPRRVIITFLGNRGISTTYRHQEKNYEGSVFAEALRRFTTYDLMLVCVTEDAEKNTWPILEALNDPRIEKVPIPTGRTTEEMWETFTCITDRVQKGDIVTFDITHGLRSLPFLVFLFAAYLKAAKEVQIKAVYYGALELGSGGPRPAPTAPPEQKTASAPSTPAPVINLSEFVSMIDWIMATIQFTKRGDGQDLADLIKDEPDLSNAIRDTSLALALSRPLSTMASAVQLKAALDQPASGSAGKNKPFDVLRDQVRDAYAGFALANPREASQLQLNLRNQSNMTRWYLDRLLYVQAVTLARELLITTVGFLLNVKVKDLFDEHCRRCLIEAAIKQYNAEREGCTFKGHPSPRYGDFMELQQARAIADLYAKLGKIRNDLAHTEMRKKPTPAAEIIEKASELCDQVCALADSVV